MLTVLYGKIVLSSITIITRVLTFLFGSGIATSGRKPITGLIKCKKRMIYIINAKINSKVFNDKIDNFVAFGKALQTGDVLDRRSSVAVSERSQFSHKIGKILF
jgi:hypothetical protein